VTTLPSIAQIEQLHRKYARTSEELDLVFQHCQIVQEIAKQLIKANQTLDINADLVQVGCLLHDIGVYIVLATPGTPYIRHGVLGGNILTKEGFPEEISRFASCHTGVGLSRAEIVSSSLPLPAQDFFARTREERLVMYADKFHSKTNPPKFNKLSSYRKQATQFGVDNVARLDALVREFGIPDLVPLVAKYKQEIK